MRSVTMVISLLLISLFAVCSVHAYIYYAEAEDFDPDKSEPIKGGAVWSVVENRDASNEKYVKYNGPHAGATTSLLYPLSNVGSTSGKWMIWILCIMPDGGSDSYFFYVSTDGGDDWGPQQAAHGGGVWPDWKWQSWALTTPFEKGGDNVLRIAERENSQADLICVRDDGLVPSLDEYEKWQEEHKLEDMAVGPVHKTATTWANIKSAH